ATYPSVTRADLPASLSKKWITDILRRRIGYRGLIASDDREMGGGRKAAPIGRAAVGFIRACGDLGLIWHEAENSQRDLETMAHVCEWAIQVGKLEIAEAALAGVGPIPLRAGQVRSTPSWNSWGMWSFPILRTSGG